MDQSGVFDLAKKTEKKRKNNGGIGIKKEEVKKKDYLTNNLQTVQENALCSLTNLTFGIHASGYDKDLYWNKEVNTK